MYNFWRTTSALSSNFPKCDLRICFAKTISSFYDNCICLSRASRAWKRAAYYVHVCGRPPLWTSELWPSRIETISSSEPVGRQTRAGWKISCYARECGQLQSKCLLSHQDCFGFAFVGVRCTHRYKR